MIARGTDIPPAADNKPVAEPTGVAASRMMAVQMARDGSGGPDRCIDGVAATGPAGVDRGDVALLAVTDTVNQSKGDQDPPPGSSLIVVPVHLQQDVDHGAVQLGPAAAVGGEVRAADDTPRGVTVTAPPAGALRLQDGRRPSAAAGSEDGCGRPSVCHRPGQAEQTAARPASVRTSRRGPLDVVSRAAARSPSSGSVADRMAEAPWKRLFSVRAYTRRCPSPERLGRLRRSGGGLPVTSTSVARPSRFRS